MGRKDTILSPPVGELVKNSRVEYVRLSGRIVPTKFPTKGRGEGDPLNGRLLASSFCSRAHISRLFFFSIPSPSLPFFIRQESEGRRMSTTPRRLISGLIKYLSTGKNQQGGYFAVTVARYGKYLCQLRIPGARPFRRPCSKEFL